MTTFISKSNSTFRRCNAMKLLVGCLMIGLSASVFGNQWRTTSGGAFTDSTRWNPQTVPSASSDQAWWWVDAQGDYTVTLPEGEWTNEAQWRVDVRKETTAFTFDGSQTVWSPSAHASADYCGEPFAFYDLVSHYFSLEMYKDKKGAPFKFTHPVFRASGAGGVSALHFDSGVFNFYDPEGAAHNYDFTVANGVSSHALLGVHGAIVSVANVNVRSSATRTTLLVDAGTLEAKTVLDIPTASGGDSRTTVEVVVTNTGTLKAGYLTFGRSGKSRDLRVKVADGGRLELPIPADYKFSQQTGGSTLDWQVSNGGTVYLGHNLAFAWGDGTTANVHLDGGNWLSYNETTIGSDSENVTCVFAATNSFIDAYQKNATAMFRLNQDMIVKDTIWTNNYLYAYGANSSPSLTVEGGKWVNLSRLYFGTPNGATMTVDGGDHEWFGQIYVGYEEDKVGTVTFKSGKVKMSSTEMIALGYNGTGTLNIEGGELSFPDGGGLSLGHTLSGKGYARMTGGTISVPSCETGLSVGRYGFGQFLMEGGEITLGHGLWLGHVGREVSDTYKGFFRQTGGKVTAQYVNLCENSAKAEVALDGGAFTVGYVESRGGSTASGGSGNAILSADGGTLKAKFATTGFVKKIDGIVLGAEGLVIDTDYDVTIDNVPVTSKSGANGRLVKRGSGTLTLAGDIANDVTVVVERGQVAFGKTVEIGSLTIGTTTNAAAISLAAGVVLTVKGTVDVIHNNSSDDFSFTKGADGKTQIIKDGSAAQTLVMRLDDAVISNVEEKVLFRSKDTFKTVVASGATLNLNGCVSRGAFLKEGAGKTQLSNVNNEFYGNVTVNGGALAVSDLRGLGLDFAASPLLSLVTGAFFYEGDASGVTSAILTGRGDPATSPLVVRTDADATFAGGIDVTSGALVKTGEGTLTLKASDGQKAVVGSTGTGTGANGCPQGTIAIGDDGAFAGEHGGLNVVEGTLVLRGSGTETIQAASGVIAVGLNVSGISVQPKLTVDGATLNNNMHLFVGGYVQPNGPVFATNATLEAVNGATIKCDTLRVGTESGSRGCYPYIHLDNATLDIGFRANCADHQSNVHAKYRFENGSTYKVGSYNYSSWQTYWEGDAEFVFDDSTYAIAGNSKWGDLYLRNGGRGSMVFQNGSTAYLKTIAKYSGGDDRQLLLAFDASAWIASDDDYDFIFRGGEGMTVECRAGGMRLPVPTEKTWTVHQKITGAGGIVKEGEGTLVFDTAAYYDTYNGERKQWSDSASWAFTGTAEVKAGTLEVRSGACSATAQAEVASGAVFVPASGLEFGSVSGTGTVRGGSLVNCRLQGVTVDGTTLVRPTVALTIDKSTGRATGVPHFSNIVTTGRMTFDFGRTSADPLPQHGFSCTVATYTGDAPDVSKWCVKNCGFAGASGTFVAADGAVTMTLGYSGMMLIVK